jgi:hypothetical protein
MKVAATIILLSLVLGIVVPPPFDLTYSVHSIGTIDVCHSAVPALASGGEMPCVHERIPDQHPAVFVTTLDQQDPLFLLSDFPTSIDRPPRF